MPPFVPGLELSRAFYAEVVGPLLDAHFSGLPHAATLIGPGSEVLGFDTAISTDHHWGPRLLLFLSEHDFERYKQQIDNALADNLPYTFRGYPTNFGPPDEIGVRLLKETEAGPVSHRVEIYTVPAFFEQYLGIDPNRQIGVADWLTFSEHRLLAVTAGDVFLDGLGELGQARARLRYYPHDIWLYLLASQWAKIAQEEAFMGRAGDVGDEIGSRVIATRLVQHLMRLCFLMERRYAPYSKWFGTAFSRLDSAQALLPVLHRVLAADSWHEREKHLSAAYGITAKMHNDLGITASLGTEVASYHERPYMVIHADRFVDAIRHAITDEEVKRISVLIGSVNQFIDSTDLLENLWLTDKLKALYIGSE
jgi:hypothetical protein